MENNEINYTPVVLAYPNEGYTLEEIDELIRTLKTFQKETAEQFEGKTVRLYLLPEEQVTMLDKLNRGA